MSDLLIVLIYGLMQAGLYTLVALGITLIFGVTDILNFAHGEFVTIGAFGVILLSPPLGFPLALAATMAGLAAFAAALYLLAYRHTVGDHLKALAVSLGVLILVQNVMLRQFGSLPRRGPRIEGRLLLPGGHQIATSRIAATMIVVVLVSMLYLALRRSWVGLALRACGDDAAAAATVGLSARRVGLAAFVVSALLAGAAGVTLGSVTPVTPFIGMTFLLKGFVVVVIGGMGSATGALAAAAMLGIVESLGARYLDPALSDAYGFVLMILVLMAWPQGLFNRRAVRAG